jgi:hypothetical protein
MRIVAVVRVRDQADILEAVLAFHLAAGVDTVLAVDHRSQDGSEAILRRYEARGRLVLLRERGEGFELTRSELARLAAEELGADWVLHPDGDEFWWPRGGSWKELLRLVPPRYGLLRGFWRHFVPRPQAPGHPLERLTVRISPYAARTRPADPFHPGAKVAHRGRASLRLKKGAHDLEGGELRPLRGWYPFEILHFPLRSLPQAQRKYEQMEEALRRSALPVPPHVERAAAEAAEGRFREWYGTLVVDETALGRGLADGSLALDTRLRDALRALAGVPELALGQEFPAVQGAPLVPFFAPSSPAEQAAFADEAQVIEGREADVRLRARVEALERRAAALEQRPIDSARRLARRLRRSVGRGRR